MLSSTNSFEVEGASGSTLSSSSTSLPTALSELQQVFESFAERASMPSNANSLRHSRLGRRSSFLRSFVPSFLRPAALPVNESKDDTVDDEAGEISLAANSAASTAEEEAKQAAIAAAILEKQNAAATLLQKGVRHRLFQIKDREQHEKRAFVVLWRSYQDQKPRPAVAGPLVELVSVLEEYCRLLKKSKDVLTKSWRGGKADDETKTANAITQVKCVLPLRSRSTTDLLSPTASSTAPSEALSAT